ncbi:MAG: cell division protein FtsZ [Alphaproteobacteria bacterium]|nr:cell division protein FtsZ [Alphaproteobacteria bacterium]
MPVKLAVPETNMITLKPRISVVGVGGGGGNAVNNMITKTLEGVDFIVANTDAQALANSKCTRRIQLGVETTRGLGAGACPEVGKAAAEEARAEIEKELEGANMVFITAGMGGGTGSGAAPVIAKIAKEKGILTIGVITKPFQFEGKKRAQIAEKAVEEFISSVDSIIIIPNQNLFRIADKNTTLADAFVMADNVLYSGVRSITDLMTMPGLINLDFADVKNIMSDKGKSIMGTGEAEGDNRAIKAAEEALSNPLLDYNNMSGAKGVLINITGGPDITLFEVDEAANRIKEEVDEEANIIFGSSFDETLTGKIRVSIVATGIGEAKNVQNKPAPITNYLEESYNSGSSIPNIPSDEIDSNLAKFAATIVPESIEEESKEVVEEQEEVSPIEDIIPEEEIKVANEPIAIIDDLLNEQEDDNENANSSVMSDMPQASSLFNAVMNRTERNDIDAQLESALSAQGNIFSSSNAPRIVDEEEPELFANTPQIFATPSRQERNEELIVPEDKEYKPTFLDRVTGRSILLNRNKKKAEREQQHYQEPVTPSLASGDDYAENDLSIPSFLRRK